MNFSFQRLQSTATKYFLASLGNPEPRYELTRHNIGHRFVTKLVDFYWKDHIYKSGSIWKSYKFTNIVIYKSNDSYMNMQGSPISRNLKKYPDHALIIVHDSCYSPVGKYKVRQPRSAPQGHNGLKSVISRCTNDHLKFGIGIGYNRDLDLDKFVLQKFDQQELDTIDSVVIPKVVKELELMLEKGLATE